MQASTAAAIRELLPASEVEIRERLPRVGPDAIRGALRRWARRGQVVESHGVYMPALRPVDDVQVVRERKGNKNPPVRTASKTCRTCGVTYDSVFRYFGRSDRKDCFTCQPIRHRLVRPAGRQRIPTRQRCRCCGVTRPAADFPTDLRYRSGLSRRCRLCTPGMAERGLHE